MSHAAATHEDSPAPGRDDPRKLVAIVLGIAAVIAVMLTAFATPALNSGAEDLPLAVSGPEEAVAQVTANLEKQGADTFDVTTYDSAADGADAIESREAIGGIAVGADGVTIQTAAGAGTPYLSVLNGIGAQLEASGQTVTYDELAPTTEDDPSGNALGTLGLPLIFGGMAGAVVLTIAYRGSTVSRLGAALGIAILGGLVATAILQFGFGAFDGSYLLTSLAVSAGIAAVSFTVLGLAAVLGYGGIGLGAVTMLFVSNPLSGLATGPAWLPAPWGAVGQCLPVGAAGSAIRSAVYFDGAGATGAWVALGVWILAGLALAWVGSARSARAGVA